MNRDCIVESTLNSEAPRRRPGLIVVADTLSFGTRGRTELIDLTDRVVEMIGRSGVSEGLAQLFSFHTTTALVVNELEPALTHDVTGLLERLVARQVRGATIGRNCRGATAAMPRPTCARCCWVPASSFRSVPGGPRSAASRALCSWSWTARASGRSG